MNAKGITVQSLFIVLFAVVSISVTAQDRLFTYTYQSGVLNKGQKELEIWNTLRTGRENYYSRLDNRTEFEIGLGKNLQTAFYLNLTTKTKTVEALGVKGLESENEISFSNEWKYKIMDAVANPFGLGLYAEYGIGSSEFELEGKLILDKKIGNLTIAGNGIYELEIKPTFENNAKAWAKEKKVDFNVSAAYALNSTFNITLENTYRNVFEDNNLMHSAIYSGLGFSYIMDSFWVNFTVLPQIKSFKGETNNTLNLNEYEKVQIRLLFSYAFQ